MAIPRTGGARTEDCGKLPLPTVKSHTKRAGHELGGCGKPVRRYFSAKHLSVFPVGWSRGPHTFRGRK